MILGQLCDLAFWPHPSPWPWSWNFKVRVWNSFISGMGRPIDMELALSQEWDGRLTWNEKDVSHPFMTMILTSVTMVGWADVLDSDWGDFRRRHAVDISSFKHCFTHHHQWILWFHWWIISSVKNYEIIYRSDVQVTFGLHGHLRYSLVLCYQTTFNKYCLTEWISKLPGNEFENVVCKITAILSMHQCALHSKFIALKVAMNK